MGSLLWTPLLVGGHSAIALFRGSHARSASSRIVAFSTAGASSGDKLEVHSTYPVPRISVPRRRSQERARSGDFFNMTSSTCSQADYRDRLPRPMGLENIHSVWRRALRASLFGSSAGEVDENSSGGPPSFAEGCSRLAPPGWQGASCRPITRGNRTFR